MKFHMLTLLAVGLMAMCARSALAEEQYASCSFRIEVREGCLWTDWSYDRVRYADSVSSADGSPMSLSEANALIEARLKSLVLAQYDDARYNPLEFRREIVAPTRADASPFSTWFYHYERFVFGSGPQCLEASSEYLVEPETVACLPAR